MDSAQKKKEKKERQRLKKNNGRIEPDKDDTDMVLSGSAFVQSVVKKNKGNSNNSNVNVNKCKGTETRNQDYSYLDCASISDDSQGFTTVLRDKHGHKSIPQTTPEEYRNRAYNLIIENQKYLAIDYLSKAIEFDATDMRHFINRSYCYLSAGEYSEAINDIHHIIAHISDEIQLSKMKCREAQALVGMQNFEGAMECFNESLNFMPNSAPVKCERMRMKVIELKMLGFPEEDILELLHNDSEITIKNAVTFLTDTSIDAPEENVQNNGIEDDIYYSDSEEYPSNTRLFMQIIGFDDENEDRSWHENFHTQCIPDNTPWRFKKTVTTNELKIIKAAAVAKSVPKKIVEPADKSIWVGEINPKITESILMKHFSKFGKIASAFIRSSKYAFVNFQDTDSAQKAIDAQSIKIDDHVLPIKPGKRAK